MQNYFVIAFASICIYLLTGILGKYGRFIKRRVPGLGECLGFVVSVLGSAVLALFALAIPDEKIVLGIVPFYISFTFLSNTLFALALITLIGGRARKLGKHLRLLYILPAVAFIAAASNGYSRLLVVSLEKAADGFGYTYTMGGLSVPMVIYSYALVALVFVYAMISAQSTRQKDKKLIWILLVASVIPSACSLLEVASPYLASVHISNFMMTFPLLLIVYVFYGYLVSARNKAVARTNEAYVVFDRWGNCVDSNEACRAFFEKYLEAQRPDRQALYDLVGWSEGGQPDKEFVLDDQGHPKYYQALSFPISDTISRHSGQGYLLREITEFREKMNELSALATIDALTGVKNRRYFEGYANEMFARARTKNDRITVLMLDIDLFKNVNDTYGHLVGDEVLVALCRICEGVLRKDDVFCRYGGEEFVVLLEKASADGGRDLAERMRQAVRAQSIKTDGGDVDITVSIGGCSMRARGGDDISAWVDKADEMLYKAKRNGRDRVEYYAHSDG